MAVLKHRYEPARDAQRMLELVYCDPHSSVHTTDLPYRLCSWAFENPDGIALWENEQGELMAWAVLQTPFWCIDIALHPNAPPEMYTLVLEWLEGAVSRTHETRFGHPVWFVNLFAHQTKYVFDLEATGFACQKSVPQNPWSKVIMRYEPPLKLPSSVVPSGYVIRPLKGASEVQAYVDLHRSAFQSENMTELWRERTLQHPVYLPDFDLVAESAEGSLVGFCVCWFAPDEGGIPTGRIEPMGVSEAHRRHGLGKALLAEGVRILVQHGAEQIFVECDVFDMDSPDPAFALYESAGFRTFYEVRVFRKDYK